MGRSLITGYTRPRPVDSEAIDKCIVRTFDVERKRRHSIGDDYREKKMDTIDVGKFDNSQISMHDVWQKKYLDTQGEFVPMNADWVCPRCGWRHCQGYPPLKCDCCGLESPLGLLVREGVFKR